MDLQVDIGVSDKHTEIPKMEAVYCMPQKLRYLPTSLPTLKTRRPILISNVVDFNESLLDVHHFGLLLMGICSNRSS
jgi:hypothetical protein